MRHLRFEIPDNLHTALKIRAAREGVSIKDYVMRLLAEALAEELEENGEQ